MFDRFPNNIDKYYMFFALHVCKYIRPVDAYHLKVPWQIFKPVTLHLNEDAASHDHIASQDVKVDNASQQIRMYFRCMAKARQGQWTGVAYSKDGIRFTAKPDLLGKFYFHEWPWQNHWSAIGRNNNERLGGTVSKLAS